MDRWARGAVSPSIHQLGRLQHTTIISGNTVRVRGESRSELCASMGDFRNPLKGTWTSEGTTLTMGGSNYCTLFELHFPSLTT